MYIKVTYDQEFDDLMMHLRSKYPAKLFDIDGIGKQLDMCNFSRNFFAANTTADASVDANSNVDDVSVVTYNVELPKPFFKMNSYYILWKELKRLYGHAKANEIIEMQLTGDIYIHDFHGVASGTPYCFNYSTYDIVMKGLPMIKKVKSIPPKYLHAFKSQIEQFIIIASNSTLGATGLADLLITLSYYAKNIVETKSDAHYKFQTEDDCWTYVAEMMTSFIYSVNFSLRGNQSPFVNISVFDRFFLEKLCSDYLFPDGSHPDIKYVQRLQAIFLDIMNREMERTPLTFPIVTACFSVDAGNNIQDEEFLDFIAEKNLRYGFINIYCGKTSTLSSCCRLRSETDTEYFNSFGSGSSKIGSLGVCAINLPRLALKANKSKVAYLTMLTDMVEVCAAVNNAKRHIVKKRIANGNAPLYALGFMDLNKQYSTVGVNGLNEAVEIMGYKITDEEGQQFVLDVLAVINTQNARFEKQYGAPQNCEQVPGENMSIKIVEKDKLLGYKTDYEMYSNQFIPLTATADILDRIKLQGIFDQHFSGGAICHINVDAPIQDKAKIKELMRTTAKMGVIYHAINYNLQECAAGHMSVGRKEACSVCGEPIINNFTRVVGFLTNTKNWHKVRREIDYPHRQFYENIDDAVHAGE